MKKLNTEMKQKNQKEAMQTTDGRRKETGDSIKDVLRLEDGYIIMDGFDHIKGKEVYFAPFPGGVVIYEDVLRVQDYYHCVKAADRIKDDALYEELLGRDLVSSEFFYLEGSKGYFEVKPTRRPSPWKRLAKNIEKCSRIIIGTDGNRINVSSE